MREEDEAACEAGVASRSPSQRRSARAGRARLSVVIEHSLDAPHSILVLRPKSALTEADFTQLARTVDPFIEGHGMLAGILIEAATFPGWNSFGALVAHLRFVRDHHRRVRRIAVVTDALLGDLAQKLASHFVSAEIRHFPAGRSDAARRWILDQSQPSA